MKHKTIYFTDKEQEKIRTKSPNIKTKNDNLNVENSSNEETIIITEAKIDLNTATINDLKKIDLLDTTEIEKINNILEREVIFSFEELKDLTKLNNTQLNSLKQHTFIDNSKAILEKKLLKIINDNNIRNHPILNGLTKNHIADISRMKGINQHFNSIIELKHKINLSQHEIILLKKNILNLPLETPKEENKKENEKTKHVKIKMEKPKNNLTSKHKPIYINSSPKTDLNTLSFLHLYQINKIISLRNSGFIFNSYEEIKNKLNLNPVQLKEIKKVTIIDKIQQNSNLTKKENNFNQTTQIKRINFNTCNKNEIINLKIFSLDEINKIIKLRDEGKEFNYFQDFKKNLNLSNNKLNKLSKTVRIIQSTNNTRKKILPNDIKKKKINFNKSKLTDLMKIKILSSEDITKISILRKNGIIFNSFDDLEKKADINHRKIIKLQESFIIDPDNIENKEIVDLKDNMKKIDEIKKDKYAKKESKNPNNTKKEIKNKIDINESDEQTLTQIPHINIIKAKKIIDLRSQNIHITSYQDLESKLNLNPSQIEKIKEVTVISKPKINSGRILDI